MRNITQIDIYRQWLGDIIIGALYNSPLPGRKDDTASFGIFEKNGQLLWKDFGLGDQWGNKPENLVQYMEGLSLDGRGYYEAIELIKKNVGVNTLSKPLTQLKRLAKADTTAYIKGRKPLDFEQAYWDRFSISPEELEHENITGLDFFSWDGSDTPSIASTPEDPAFVYWWNKSPASWKLYRPKTKNKREKFRQLNIQGVIEGWNSMMVEWEIVNNIPFDILFILSSSKDRLVTKRCMRLCSDLHTSAINPRGESDRVEIVANSEFIKSISTRQIILYDADDPGYISSKELAEQTGFETYDMRNQLGGQKDISDFIDAERGAHSYSQLYTILSSFI